MKKFVLILVTIIVICISVYALYAFSNSTTSSTTTSTKTTSFVETTLSKEEVLKNRITDVNDSIINSSKEEIGYLEMEYLGYINFQDFISGAKSDPSEYFFIGTSVNEIAKSYSDNLRFIKNSEVLEYLQKNNMMDADYLFIYRTVKKNAYGKEEKSMSYTLVRENGGNDLGFYRWDFDGHKEVDAWYLFMMAIVDKCTHNY